MRIKKILQRIWRFFRWQIKNMRNETKKLLAVSLAALVVGGFCGGKICESVQQKKAEEEAKFNALSEAEKAAIQARAKEKARKISDLHLRYRQTTVLIRVSSASVFLKLFVQ